MTRTAMSAALLCVGVLLLSEPIQAAQAPRTMPVLRAPAISRPSIRPAPVRPRAMPVAPRAFHPGPQPKLHVLHKKPHHLRRHRFARHRIFSVPVVHRVFGAPEVYSGIEAAAETARAIARTGSTVGCATEAVTVPGDGGKTITIIRC